MKSKNAIWIIIFLAVFLRFYKLGIIPFGYNWDETSIIYNSWGIAEWYRDEWAVKLPMAFRSFGDYKAPLMFYLLAIPYKLFGVTPSLIRVYSAASGVLLVATTYFLAKELFSKSKSIPLISALLMTLSPWAINFSRVGFEANIGLSLVGLGGLFLLKGVKNSKWWIWSALFYGLSIFAYHSTKIFVPLFLLTFAYTYKKKILAERKNSLISIVMFLLITAPITFVTFFGDGFERGLTMIFFDGSHQFRAWANIASEFIENIKNTISWNFLVGGKDDVGLRHLVPGSGILYLAELPFFISGLYIAFKNRAKRSNQFLLYWFVIGMLPALFSHQTPHAVRSLLVMPAMQIITAASVVQLLSALKEQKKFMRAGMIGMVSIFLLMNFSAYIKSYYNEYAKESAWEFQYGYEEAIKISTQMGRTKEKIIFTDAYGQPYIYVLLHNQIKPKQFLAGALANYEFHSIDWPTNKSNSVIVGTPEEIPPTDPAVKHLVKVPGTEQIVFVIAETPRE